MRTPEELLNKFIEGYNNKDISIIDDFMNLFSKQKSIEMIGIGATKPGNYEWFIGQKEIKEIIISDWTYWGNVKFDIDTLKITENNNTAWFRLCVSLEQINPSEETWEFFLNQMKELLEEKDKKVADRMFNATHYGMRRIYERNLGEGHLFDMIITGVLVNEDGWKFHTLHWSMPVE